MVGRTSNFLLGAVYIALISCSSGSNKTTSNNSLAPFTPSTSAASQPSHLGGSSDPSEFVGLAGVEAFYLTSPYAAVLANCVNAQSEAYACPLAQLPFIAEEANTPSVEAIMARVVVSHRWMGESFKDVLLHLPADALQLFRAVTAVVIADDVHPSYFTTITGAIYLDPALLWRTRADKSLFVASEENAAQNAEESLAFRAWSRYVDKQGNALPEYSALDSSERSTEDLLPALAAVLFHELAHANDFLPPDETAFVTPNQPVFEVATEMRGRRASDLLYAQYPLVKSELSHFSQVLYLHQGQFTEAELTMSASEFAEQLDPLAVNDDYALVHQFEDAAMLFEEVMMRYHFGLYRELAYLNVPENAGEQDCNSYTVAWGMRGRIARADIQMRAQLVVETILANADWPAFFASLGEPDYLPLGRGWCDLSAPVKFAPLGELVPIGGFAF